ncbi:MAG TPA: hypothetical protein VMG12_40700 [Polyangiaceae bacterium]|nr:hypothetical protein [Polyangiaceae bacterium]
MIRASNRAPHRLEPLPSPARRLRAAFGAASVALLMGSACGDDPAPAPPIVADAGPACERGTQNCACIGGSSCQGDLLCISGRCSVTDDGPDEPAPPRPRPPPDIVLPDPEPPPVSDAGAADAGSEDASVPGEADPTPGTPTPDAGNDAG